ncbi:MAG TPA: hypothetical protein VE933_00430, partial [Chitinophagaceae bacterium]|nr:hypothetical protein [Chitinophagaceae bacterium]
MKKYFLLSVLYLFILQPVGATGCDSIVVKVSRSFSSYSGWTTSVVSYTFNDGLLRIFRGPYNEITYYYDSLNRESEAINSQNGTINSKNVHYYSSVTGSDTAAIAFRFNGQNYYYSSGQFYFYDANQNLQMTVFENYDTLSMQWDTTSYELSFYSPDSLTRMDTVYSYPGNSVVYYDATTWDSLGRVISSSSYGGLSW